MKLIEIRKYGKAIKNFDGSYRDQYAYRGVALTPLELELVLQVNELIQYHNSKP